MSNHNNHSMGLTVVITTYNRKEPLLDQLKSLEKQGQYDKYNIIVIDNHSDYDVREWLKDNLVPDFFSIIRLEVRPVNIGGTLNIVTSFLFPNTQWMWLLSDDDITTPQSLQTVLSDIEKHKDDDVCWMKYSIEGHFKPNKDFETDSITDVFKYYSTPSKGAGEFVFMSNNVYCLPRIMPVYSSLCLCLDTCMSQILLPLLAIKLNHKKVLFSSRCLTNYVQGRISYGLLRAYSRFGNVLSSDLKCSKEEINAFKNIHFFFNTGLISALAAIENNSLRNYYFKRIFISHYRLLSFRGIGCIMLYLLLKLVGGKYFLSILNNIRAFKGKI